MATEGWLRGAVIIGVTAFAIRAEAATPVRDAYDLAARTLDELRSQRAPVIAPLVPPVPVAVTWKAKRLASLDLGGPALAMIGADAQHDGVGELYVVTDARLVALALQQGVLQEVASVTLDQVRPAIEPRTPLATLVAVPAADGTLAIVAHPSTRAHGITATWSAPGALTGTPVDGYLACADDAATATTTAAGRSLLVRGGVEIAAVRCATRLVDPRGAPLRITATTLASRQLEIHVEPGRDVRLPGVGYAIEITDADRDGSPEVIAAGDAPRGDGDEVIVWGLTTGKPKKLFAKTFTGGVVAIAAADLDGDGDVEIVAAVRLPGATRVDLWRLNQ